MNPANHGGVSPAALPKNWLNAKGPANPEAKKILAEAETLRGIKLLVPADLITPSKSEP